ncbi:8346_t:CDS:2, partial [Entrophospora sp. SA101]
MSKKVASHALKNNDFEVWWSSNDKSPTSSGVGLMIKKSISIYVQKVKESNDPDKLELDRMNNKKIDRKYHFIKFLQNKNYIDIHTNIEDDKCYTWKNNNSTSRIDLIWMPNNMLDEEANIKRKQMRRQVFSFDNMKEEDWLKYAETSDNLWKDSQMNKFKFPENPGHHDLNRMWDAVRNTLIKTAEKTIPKRWVSESFKYIKSKELIKNYSYLRKVNKILIKFNNIKIYNDKIPSQTEWNKDIKILNNIINNGKFEELQIQERIHNGNIKQIKKDIKQIHKLLYTLCQIEEDKWREAQIKFFSLKRCNNFNLEKGKFISSCLERSKRKITLDKIIIETKDGLELITNSNTIKNQWKRQYEPLNFINDKWYKYIMQPPTFEEWYKLVKSLPNNKAAGPSKITNEMIKYAGQNINKAVWRLVCACLKSPLKNRLIMFLDQLRSYDGSYLLTWKEITDKHFNKKNFSRKPKWMESLKTS